MATAHALPYLANCSMLFTEVPLLERPAAAKAAGFDTVEFWWPWPDQPVPGDADVDAFVTAVQDAGVQLAGLNFFAGDLAGPDCGVLSIPSRSLSSSATTSTSPSASASGWAPRRSTPSTATGVDDATPEAAGRLWRPRTSRTRGQGRRPPRRAPCSSSRSAVPKPYPLRTADDAVGVVDRVRATGTANVGFLCDLFHLANNGDDVDAAIARHADRVAHVQIADAPGRGEPGSGDLPLDAVAGRAGAVPGTPARSASSTSRRPRP